MPGIVVLSDEEQFRLFTEKHSVKDFRIFCDNVRFYAYLDERKILYRPLDEFLIKDKWQTINVWGCTQVLQWIKICGEEKTFPDFDIPSVIYNFFSRTLIQAAKNFHYAKWMLDECRPTEVIIFKSREKRAYPHFSGNAFLNYFLEDLARKQNISFKILESSKKIEGGIAPGHIPFRKKITQLFKQWIHVLYGFKAKPSTEPHLFAHGSLRHLGSTMKELVKKGQKVALFDFEFHREQFDFARANGIPYVIPAGLPECEDYKEESFVENAVNNLKDSLNQSALAHHFFFENYDFKLFIQEFVFTNMTDYFKSLCRNANLYESLYKNAQVEGFLLDEDYALRGGFLAAFFKAKNVPLFHVAHAIYPLDFSVLERDQVMGQSDVLFVNSEYEKQMCGARGWNKEKIHVTGTPRYDRLIHMKKEYKRNAQSAEKKQIFYCATSLWLHSPDQTGYLGSEITLFGETQVPAVTGALNALKDLPVSTLVKPHSYEGEPMWNAFVKEKFPNVPIVVAKHSDDIFKIYMESKAMVVAYRSAAMIESAICGLPTFFINFRRFDSPSLYDFASRGCCKVVHSEEELKREVKALFPGVPENRGKDSLEYYLGPRDGKATERVADEIISCIHSETKASSGMLYV